MSIAFESESTKPSSFSINRIDFIGIPKGESIIGSYNDRYAYDNEFPQQRIQFDYSFAIAKYPLTNQQFSIYIQNAGVKTKAEIAGGMIGSSRNSKANWRMPDGFSGIEGKEDHPVVQVNWLEAQDFCCWLNDRCGRELPAGFTFRLPTEVEWERAARSEDGRVYPWGNDFVNENCNTNYLTAAVNSHSPAGDSPRGVADMAGNVWEWTNTIFSYQFKYPYDPRDGREEFTTDGSRVIRGGGYQMNVNMERTCRCACRSTGLQVEGENNIGVHIAIAPPLSMISKASNATLSNELTLFATT
jgi:formylglycine-generating enzyme required for sulfatase activity